MKKLSQLMMIGALVLIQSCNEKPQLVWQDEFDGRELDTTRWTAYVGDGCPDLCGFGNNELQYYTGRQSATMTTKVNAKVYYYFN